MKLFALAALFGLSLAVQAAAADYYVDAVFGDDVSGTGSASAPWKTISLGVGKAQGLDTVHVNPGIYNLTNGELFPLQVAAGVSLIGSGYHMSVIDGKGVDWSSTGSLITLNGDGEVAGFMLRNGPTIGWYDAAITCWTEGSITIRDNLFAGPNLIRGVLFYDGAATSTSTGSATIYNNICHDIGPADAIWTFQCPTIACYHNTVAGSGRTGIVIGQGTITTSGIIANNIAYNNGFVGIEGDTPNVQLHNNCLYQNVAGGTIGTFGSEIGTLVALPRFVDEADSDYHLTPGSPCVNAGANSGVIVDIDGDARAVDGGYDIGADEAVRPGMYVRRPIEQGKISALVTTGNPGDVYYQIAGAVPATIPTGYGTLFLDPNFMLIIKVGVMPASGAAVTPVGIGAAPAYIGIPVILQSLVKYTLSGPVTLVLL